MFLTIFTPSYNRAHLLPKLFESILAQNAKNFEWIIVDDGSIDNTEEVVEGFRRIADFSIIYFRKKNEGKHLAINKGVELAKGKLFFIVDSDDYLVNSASELIQKYYLQIQNENSLGGISFRRGYSVTKPIGTTRKFNDFIADIFTFRYYENIKGDMAEVYKTEVIREFPFPKIEGEKYCPESLIWNRIGLKYKLLWTSHIIYICEYLKDGLTDRIVKIRTESPQYASLYYSEFCSMRTPLVQKIKGGINFWRFAFNDETRSLKEKQRQLPNKLFIFLIPLGYALYLNDKRVHL
ncbi:MAG: glycosyltransferase family 2 protein [Aequorivita sp.]